MPISPERLDRFSRVIAQNDRKKICFQIGTVRKMWVTAGSATDTVFPAPGMDGKGK